MLNTTKSSRIFKLNLLKNMKYGFAALFFQLAGTVMFLYVVTASSGKAHQNDSAGGSAIVGAAGVVDGSLWARVVAAYEATAPPAGGI